MRSTRYIALRKARNRRLKKSLGVAMAKGKMRFNPRDYHPNENYTFQNDEEFTPEHHETYKDNIYNGVPQTLSDGLKNFRHVAGEGADLTKLQNPFAHEGRRWSEVLNEKYTPDELLGHVKTATSKTPFMEDEANEHTMKMHRFELRDLSRQKSKDDRTKQEEQGVAQRRRVYLSTGRNMGMNKPEEFADKQEEEYQRKLFNRRYNRGGE